MAQSVVYADLKFSMAPPLTAPAGPTAPDEDDSPYENVPRGPVPAQPSPGRWPRRWRVPAGMLAASLLLLLVTTVALGACYWQVTHRLQDTSQELVAEQDRLEWEVSVREESLEQMRLELSRARAELQRAWQEGNSSRLELGSLNAELGRVMGVLGQTEKEMKEVQGELRASKSTVSSLRACINTDCCPSGWVLYRGKCLFISVEKKTWLDSHYDCRRKFASLLVQGDWPSWTVPNFVQAHGAAYWVGATIPVVGKRTPVWQDNKQLHFYNLSADCGLAAGGNIEGSKCMKKFQWICEKPPKLSSTYETLYPLLVVD
ncbi:B-cell differentiation antigen CD72-like [Tyto alba]|uniref:B-cell differentiation antigen CD72-like n=1 Tax=Tyto alba TaxID=56313 RepID=UPI001C662BFB|nr:B-cell differentiation antigen CD72-like [Tyto alba]